MSDEPKDVIFVGYEFKDFFFGTVTTPLIAFRNVNDAVKWKNGQPNREFKLVEIVC